MRRTILDKVATIRAQGEAIVASLGVAEAHGAVNATMPFELNRLRVLPFRRRAGPNSFERDAQTMITIGRCSLSRRCLCSVRSYLSIRVQAGLLSSTGLERRISTAMPLTWPSEGVLIPNLANVKETIDHLDDPTQVEEKELQEPPETPLIGPTTSFDDLDFAARSSARPGTIAGRGHIIDATQRHPEPRDSGSNIGPASEGGETAQVNITE